MQFEINIEDYLNHEEIKDEIKTALREKAREYGVRLFHSMAAQILHDAVDEALDGEAKQIIRDKALEEINKLSKYDVFREKDNFIHKENSVGQQELNKVIQENRGFLSEKVREAIEEADFKGEVYHNLEDILLETIKRGFKEE